MSLTRIKLATGPDDDLDPTGDPAGVDEVLATRLAERFVAPSTARPIPTLPSPTAPRAKGDRVFY